MRVLSYLLSRVELMVKAPPMPSSLTGTLLVFGGAALGFLLLSAELSGTSSTATQHPEEVRLPEWVREILPVFFPPRASVAGASALAAVAATASR